MDPANDSSTDFNEGPTRKLRGARARPLTQGIGLCLSGGGYRAMLFHLGTLWRLNEMGLLPKIAHVSSVSGGSITAGVLGGAWNRLTFANDSATNFAEEVAAPIIHLAHHTIDFPAVGFGMALPFVSVGEILVREYDHYLFRGKTLQDLPQPRDHSATEPGAPEFVFNATNLQSLALWRFSREAMRDWRVGEVRAPKVSLATAVAASSAFPPVLSPLVLRFEPGEVQPMDGNDLHEPPYTTKVVLSDGGVYDNMGLETVWKRYTDVLVSDAGGKMSPVPNPKGDWALQGLQVLSMGDSQVRNLRKRQLLDSFRAKGSGGRKGAYWSVRSDPAIYPAGTPFVISDEQRERLALEPTRLAGMDDAKIRDLINWGYIMADTAVRSWYAPGPTPTALPM